MIPLNSRGKQDCQTPDWAINWLLTRYPLTLDAAASDHNHRLPTYYTRRDNGLILPWHTWTFCNPPFSKIGPWVEKAISEAFEGRNSVLLLLGTVTPRWYRQNYQLAHTELLTPRFPYKGEGRSVSFGSMLMIFTEETVNKPRPDRVRIVDVSRLIV